MWSKYLHHQKGSRKFILCSKNMLLLIGLKVCEALTFFLDNIFIRFGSNLYLQIVGIPRVLVVPFL